MPAAIPGSVVTSLTGRSARDVVDVIVTPLPLSAGATTVELARLTVRVVGQHGGLDEFSVIRKVVGPLRSGRHQYGTEDRGHWAYWKREPLAYASDLLPSGPGLRAPRCYGVFDSTIYLEDVDGVPTDPRRAARQLGVWQSATAMPRVSWLSGHQLAQRIEVSDLDWSDLRVDRRAIALWDARAAVLARLAEVPRVLCHGDFHQGNLCGCASDTVVFDWGTLGLAPVGADLAHLALSTQQDLRPDYLEGLNGRFPEPLVALGYAGTLVLVGTSRIHWMLRAGVDVPDGYLDFLWANRPAVR